MINILIVDDEPNILDVQQNIIQRYFDKNDIKTYEIDTALNGNEAINLMNAKDYNLLFLDYMMPVMNGIELLDNIRIANEDKYQPYICMVTAMGTPDNLEIFKSKKASSYVLKPFKINTINLMLDTYIKPFIEKEKESLEVDEFMDFDEFEDFEDFDEFDEVIISSEEQEIMQINNLNHKKVTAQEYLRDFEDLEYILEDISEIDEMLKEIVESLDIKTFEHYKNDINTVMNLYITFLRSLSDFDKLADTLEMTKRLINNLDLNIIYEKEQKYIIETIRAILNDTSYWKDTVFIYKEAIDVFYIGASNYNSYLQLKSLLK
ncbi:MAG: response regulator [Campylobacterota bacterium]|nr:response regulator [Campylobacterota bacterium]